jgi:non-specific serine/threonine protein kinase/serine/threonine-protein kinase
VIHRDIKPSNVLVTEIQGQAVPKIIDFGLAKGLDQPLTGETIGTIDWGIVGTLQYLSPEAIEGGAKGIDVDTRTDVYALGVVLFELLVGPPALHRRGHGAAPRPRADWRAPRGRARPSTRCRKRNGRRRRGLAGPTPRHTGARCAADLDWIVLKAVARERAERYGSVADLAADIRRSLDDQPVTATPPSTVYRAGKFVRRHKAAVGAVTLAVLALAGGSSRAAARRPARTARPRGPTRKRPPPGRSRTSWRASSRARPPPQEGERGLGARPADDGADRIRTELKDQPLVRARLLETIGEVYRSNGLYDQGRPSSPRRWTYAGRSWSRRPEPADPLQSLAMLDRQAGRSAAAEAPLREAIRILRASSDPWRRRAR